MCDDIFLLAERELQKDDAANNEVNMVGLYILYVVITDVQPSSNNDRWPTKKIFCVLLVFKGYKEKILISPASYREREKEKGEQ